MATAAIQALGKAERIMLIVVEGPPGVGKTTVAQTLPGGTYVSEYDDLSPARCLADFTRSHGTCLDSTELFLLYAARTAVKARAAARNAANSGMVVVDRFHASLYVFGTVTLGLDMQFVMALVASGHLTRGLAPDLTISLDCRYQTYQDRAERRGDDAPLDANTYELQRAAFRRYFDHAAPPGVWVDTSDLTPEQVNQAVLAHLTTHVASP
jgi:thymidylate kinase